MAGCIIYGAINRKGKRILFNAMLDNFRVEINGYEGNTLLTSVFGLLWLKIYKLRVDIGSWTASKWHGKEVKVMK